MKKIEVLKKYQKYFEPKTIKAKGLKGILGLIKRSKYKIKNEYVEANNDSPTKFVYIGVNKKPLMEAKDGGFGYQGVLLQTDNRELVQCHVCGKWFAKLTTHIKNRHDLTKNDYRKKFGLLNTTALVSDATSYRLEKAGFKKYLKYKEQEISKLAKARTFAVQSSVQSRMDRKLINKAEHNNRFALCEKQLGFRLLSYVKQYKMLPSRSQKGEGRLIGKALYRRYGSVNKGLEFYNLPVLYRQGTNVELKASNNKQLFFNYNKNYNRDKVYKWIQEQCDIDTNITKYQI